MAYDIFKKKLVARDWSCGAEDLPKSSKGYAPETYWGEAQMEAWVNSAMTKPKGLFGGKPDRGEAIAMLAKHMKDKKIGPMSASAGLGAAVGSVLLPNKQEERLRNKIDDVRYDIRSAKGVIGAGVFALAGALAFLGFAKVYKAAEARSRS